MKEDLKKEIDERLKQLNLPKEMDKSWFYNFFEFLTDINYKTDNLDDLLTQLRAKSIKSIEEVDYAILETSGKLSVFKKSDDKDRV